MGKYRRRTDKKIHDNLLIIEFRCVLIVKKNKQTTNKFSF